MSYDVDYEDISSFVEEPVADYRDLRTWRAGIKLVKQIYTITREFPDDEKFGLTSQIRRAAVSVPSNIAEGNARKSLPDYLRLLSVAQGSLAEIDTQLTIASELGFVSMETFLPLRDEVQSLRRQLQAQRNSLERRSV